MSNAVASGSNGQGASLSDICWFASSAEFPNMAQRAVMQYLSLDDWKIAARLPIPAGELMLSRIRNYGWIEIRVEKQHTAIKLTPGGAQGDAEASHRRLVQGEGKMSAADKLQEFVKMLGATSRPRSQAASIVAGPSQTNLVATENTTVDSASVKVEATPAPDAERENEGTTANQALLPLTGLDLDTAIRLRWTLRDIKAKRTKITSVSPTDLKTLIEMGLVEMRDEAPMLTNEGHRTLDQ